MNPTIQILDEAKHEITSLRRQNELLRAKVEVMDLFAVVLHTAPAYPPQAMCVDIARQLEKESERLKNADAVGINPVLPVCEHSTLTVTEDGGRCHHCGADLEYDAATRKWAAEGSC